MARLVKKNTETNIPCRSGCRELWEGRTFVDREGPPICLTKAQHCFFCKSCNDKWLIDPESGLPLI